MRRWLRLRRSARGGGFVFRVSDAVQVPLRGYLLRLRLLEGDPHAADLGPGRYIRLRSPDGEERRVRIRDRAVVGGRASQRRLERTREMDAIISEQDALGDGRPVAVGWLVTGPVSAEEARAA